MNDTINPAILGSLAPGEERHTIAPVYEHRGFYYCITEILEANPQDGCYRVYEAFCQEELDWLNKNCPPSGCDHELVTWAYWQDPIATDLVNILRAEKKRDPFAGFDKTELRADLDKTLNEILKR